jgi:hypothetical protein
VRTALAAALFILTSGAQADGGQAPDPVDRSLAVLSQRLEQIIQSGNPDALAPLLAPTADREQAMGFARQEILADATRVAVRVRDRDVLLDARPNEGFRLLLEVFVEYGNRGSVRTWRLDARRRPAGPDSLEWTIAAPTRLTSVDGLYRLALAGTRQYRISNLRVTAEDLVVTIPEGTAFAADVPEGRTALVLLGRGELQFRPRPEAERGQIRLFTGDEVLRSRLDTVFLRLNPADEGDRLSKGGLVPMPVNPRDLSRAQEVFQEESVKSFGLELGDLSRDSWSLVPPQGDVLVEMRTSNLGALTYTRSGNEPEDISLFDRKRRRQIAIYPSASKRYAGGRYFSEDLESDYDVTHYAIQIHAEPEREWLEGRTEMTMRVRTHSLGTMTLRLADPLVVRSVVSPVYGRLLTLRVRNQNSVIVNLPETLVKGDELKLVVTYAGRLPGARPEREAIALAQQEPVLRDEVAIPPEPRTVYTNRSHWYPQSPVTDYATATIRVTVPEALSCVASGMPANGNPVRVEGARPGQALRLYVFTVTQPARYFAMLLTRLTPALARDVRISRETDAAAGAGVSVAAANAATPVGASIQESAQTPAGSVVRLDTLRLEMVANPRQIGRSRSLAEQAADILTTYAEILGEFPYPTFTVSLVDDSLPGGHSPAYFAIVHQPMPTTPFSWRNDPVSFDSFPQFFLAHEIAHQFWGNAVAANNYHEQWISEGFAQYFALLYAKRVRSAEDFTDILGQMRRTAISSAKYGPVWLGYRLGHLQDDSRIFRSLVYNKGALVLHMLRRMIGDDAFLRGLRRFYRESRFTKVGTDAVQRAFEAEAGRSLERFFAHWIIGSATPALAFTWRLGDGTAAGTNGDSARPGADAMAATLRFEQRGAAAEIPVTVTLRYANAQSEDVLVLVTEAVTETRVKLKGPLRSVEVNRDNAALAEIEVRRMR